MQHKRHKRCQGNNNGVIGGNNNQLTGGITLTSGGEGVSGTKGNNNGVIGGHNNWGRGGSRCGVGGSSDIMLHDSIVVDGEEGGKCLPTILQTSGKNHINHVTDDVVPAPPDDDKDGGDNDDEYDDDGYNDDDNHSVKINPTYTTAASLANTLDVTNFTTCSTNPILDKSIMQCDKLSNKEKAEKLFDKCKQQPWWDTDHVTLDVMIIIIMV
jgi:hypothetical protein